jgi:hypothetical protein
MKNVVFPAGTGTRRNPTANAPASNGSPTAASPWGSSGASSSATVVAGSRGRVFVQENGKLHMVPVQITMVSGSNAAVVPLRGTLSEGASVVVGDGATTHARSTNANSAFGSRGPGGAGGVRIGGGFRG